MPSWVVTGASRGIGLAFVLHLSSDPANTVVGVVRNITSVKNLAEEELSRKNLHFVEADISDSSAASKAAASISSLTNGALDVLINNATHSRTTIQRNKPSSFISNPDVLKTEMENTIATNVLGTMYITNCLIPLLRKGELKKLITISSGNGVRDCIKACNTSNNIVYAGSKAMMDHLLLMYSNELRPDGILVLSISPGWVNTSGKELTEEDYKMYAPGIDNFKRAYPSWDGKILEPAESVEMVLEVINKSTMEHTGDVVSHHGNNIWL